METDAVAVAIGSADSGQVWSAGAIERQDLRRLFEEAFGSPEAVRAALAYLQGKPLPQLTSQGSMFGALTRRGSTIQAVFLERAASTDILQVHDDASRLLARLDRAMAGDSCDLGPGGVPGPASSPAAGVLKGGDSGEVFLEIVIDVEDAASCGLLSRDEVEDPLAEALEASGLGEVTGGGGGMGRYVIDVEVAEERFMPALALIRSTLRGVRAPASTIIRRHQPMEETFRIDADAARDDTKQTPSGKGRRA